LLFFGGLRTGKKKESDEKYFIYVKNYSAMVGGEAFRVRAPSCFTTFAFRMPFLPLRALLDDLVEVLR